MTDRKTNKPTGTPSVSRRVSPLRRVIRVSAAAWASKAFISGPPSFLLAGPVLGGGVFREAEVDVLERRPSSPHGGEGEAVVCKPVGNGGYDGWRACHRSYVLAGPLLPDASAELGLQPSDF